MAQISVIVAVYKMPEYLPRCIEGILNQTFRDLELILVDDGSPDHCGEICDAYAAKDFRVHVIHKKNEGVCVARNTGLDWVYANSDSRWIFFHDNDDWIHPETLERLLSAAQTLHAEISICGYQETTGADPEIPEGAFTPESWTPKAFYLQHHVNATVCWGKLYSRRIFDGKRYPPGKYIEDEFLTYRLLFACERLAVIPAPLYAYFVNPAGISKKAWVPKRLDAWEAFEQQLVFFRELGDEELVHYRLRKYLENAVDYYAAAQTAPNASELKPQLRWMRGRIRDLIRRCREAQVLEFWPDYEILSKFYPLRMRFARYRREHGKK
ncbi:MAG: glycosyltransferase family 2 protein [Faecousia sp.]